MVVYNYDADLEVSDTCVRSSLLSWVELRSDIGAITNNMASFIERFLFKNDVSTSVNQLWSAFRAKCLEILYTLVVSKWSSERFNQPWITRQVRRISRRQKQAHSKVRKTNAKRDWSWYHKLRRLQTSSVAEHNLAGWLVLCHVTCHIWRSSRHSPRPLVIVYISDLQSRVCSTVWIFVDDGCCTVLSKPCMTPTRSNPTLTVSGNGKRTR